MNAWTRSGAGVQRSVFSVFVFIWLFPSSRIGLDLRHSCLKENDNLKMINVVSISKYLIDYESYNVHDNLEDFLLLWNPTCNFPRAMLRLGANISLEKYATSTRKEDFLYWETAIFCDYITLPLSYRIFLLPLLRPVGDPSTAVVANQEASHVTPFYYIRNRALTVPKR